MPANGSRVLLIGLDSVDFDYLQSHLGSLPTLKRFFTGGVVRRLDSPGDIMSASVWPTFYTGTLPGEHGRYFPVQWDAASMRFRHVASDWIDSEPFWRALAQGGLPVTTLDVPMAFPSRTTAGVEVVNWGAESFGSFHCNRPDISREIARRFGTNVLGPDVPVDLSPYPPNSPCGCETAWRAVPMAHEADGMEPFRRRLSRMPSRGALLLEGRLALEASLPPPRVGLAPLERPESSPVTTPPRG